MISEIDIEHLWEEPISDEIEEYEVNKPIDVRFPLGLYDLALTMRWNYE